MKNENSGILMTFLGGILIIILLWGNVLSFGYFILPYLIYNPSTYAIGPVILIVLALFAFINYMSN